MRLFRRFLFLAFWLALIFKVAGAQGQVPVKAPIEVVMDGKRYPSLHAYQLDRLKLKMGEVFSGIPLQEFDDQELVSIIEELRRDQAAAQGEGNTDSIPGTSSQTDSLSKEGSGEDVLLMEEMLKGYKEGHEEAPNLILDSEKMKTITISPPR